MTNLKLLTSVRDLLASPSRWTQRDYARDELGNGADPLSTEARCWCLLGAVDVCAYRLRKEEPEYLEAMTTFARLFASAGTPEQELHDAVANWNDDPSRTHEEVLAKLDELIARESAK